MAQLVTDTSLRRARLLSGLVMLAFVACHLFNHALTLISIETAEYARIWFSIIWLNPVSSTILYGSVLVHILLVLRSIYLLRSLQMPWREAMQILLGLAIPFLIIDHAAGIRFSRMLYGIDEGYDIIIRRFWITAPYLGLRQSIALVLIWAHGCFGVYFWLRYRSWYRQVAPYLLMFAVLLPIMALLGFSDAGRQMELDIPADHPHSEAGMGSPSDPPPPPQRRWSPERQATIQHITFGFRLAFGAAVILTFAARAIRGWRQRSNGFEVLYEDGHAIRAPAGFSILEASRLEGISHFSACGGKGRCSTCRVKILETDALLPEPSDLERSTLQRIHADSDVRLGCQLRPTGRVKVALLLSTRQQDDSPASDEPIRPGREEEIAVLFCDLRNFTALSETRLPYDMVFLLNRYFTIVGQSVEQAGGRIDKFIGDGAMALFGLDGNQETASADALKAACLILRNVEKLNKELEQQFAVRLRIAIGIHAGPSIVGIMGYGAAKTLTAIGDTVNVASRLETAAKEFDTSIVVSEPVMVQSGHKRDALPSRTIPIRGRSSEMKVFLISEEESRKLLS
ncbi:MULTISPECIES: adenylate/guanylate cyclase domain-containing protein [Agrobacterium]|uniref:Adenylate cyclase n=1 Tax=Agrobacterium larrymoorei TaxID=160699 RepID=A0AAJ2ESR9_9HYPH|nr:adenylate/guanylate cyclase domain-containing protein [Agrobacterium larrymoorei]MDQ1196861.1 adenylate cyclase [Rhizobium sp. SORGH_AS_0787]MDR6103480.1 adenylate cyclase [Agrobacterium larrymoorei]